MYNQCGALAFPDIMALEAVKFWSQNSYEHIDVILSASGPAGVVLYDDLKDELKILFDVFKSIYDRLSKDYTKVKPYPTITEFLLANNELVTLLQRLKFEGLNGFPILYEAAYHFLYEQLYIAQIFRAVAYNLSFNPESVVINADFRDRGLGDSTMECIYGQIYFWSLIGAEHPSLLMNVTTDEESQLPIYAIERLTTFTNEFNDINHELGMNYDGMNIEELKTIFTKFQGINEQFLGVLQEMTVNTQYLSDQLKAKLPQIFYDVLEHITQEHNYVLDLCYKIQKYFKTIK